MLSRSKRFTVEGVFVDVLIVDAKNIMEERNQSKLSTVQYVRTYEYFPYE